MRDHARRALGACLMLLASGCGVGSVHQFYRAADVAFDSTLVGVWGDSSSRESAEFSREGDRYAILYTDSDGRQGRFVGQLFRLGGATALDVSPGGLPPSAKGLAPDPYWEMLLPLHTMFWLDHGPRRLAFASFEPDTLKAYVRSHPGAVDYLYRDETLVLTSPTDALQRFVLRYRREPHVLSDSTVWWRR